jgi:hypothetical protein
VELRGKKLKNRTITLLLAAVLVTSCNNITATKPGKLDTQATVSSGQTFLTAAEMADFEKEYAFGTKSLSLSYLKRRIEKWLDKDNSFQNVNGEKLVKEIEFARFKDSQLLLDLFNDHHEYRTPVSGNILVNERRIVSVPFDTFLAQLLGETTTPVDETTPSKIAFISKRNGILDIFSVDDKISGNGQVEGDNLLQLTGNFLPENKNHWLSFTDSKVLFTEYIYSTNKIYVKEMNSDYNTPPVLLSDKTNQIAQALISPDGSKAGFMSYQNAWQLKVMDTKDDSPADGEGDNLITLPDHGNASDYALANGKVAYSFQGQGLYLYDINSGQETTLKADTGLMVQYFMSISDDGSRIAYSEENYPNHAKIKVFDTSTNTEVELAAQPDVYSYPVVISHDGKKLAYVINGSVYGRDITNINSPGNQTYLTDLNYVYSALLFLPDGRLALSTQSSRYSVSGDIKTVDPANGNMRQLTSTGNNIFRYSYDDS